MRSSAVSISVLHGRSVELPGRASSLDRRSVERGDRRSVLRLVKRVWFARPWAHGFTTRLRLYAVVWG